MLQGAIRWCLMCAVQCAQDCHLPLPGTTTDKDREKDREKEKKFITSSSTSTSSSSHKSDRLHAANDVEKKLEKSTPDSWQMHLYTSTNIINDEDTSDPFLSSVCAVLKCAALSEILRKDLEMVANVVLYTISSEEKNTKMRYSSTKKASDNYGKLIDNVVNVSSARVVSGAGVGGVDGTGVSVGVSTEECDRERDREKERDRERERERELKLSPLAMLRVYLLRLLFVTYEEHISTVIGTGVSTALRRPKSVTTSDSNEVRYFHCYLLCLIQEFLML